MRKILFVFLAGIVLTFLTAGINAQNMVRKVNDFDGDGRADYTITRNENGLKVWYVWQSTAGFKTIQWGIENDQIAAGDYDGDGKTDLAIYRRGTPDSPQSYFWFNGSSSGISVFAWGLSNDRAVQY